MVVAVISHGRESRLNEGINVTGSSINAPYSWKNATESFALVN